MRQWLVRLPAVVLIALVMGWLGLFLMFLGGPWFPGLGEFWTLYVMAASVLLWSVLSAVLGRRSLKTWAAWGMASPLLGGLLVYPPASFALIIVKFYVALPVGLVTGMLMWAIFEIGHSNRFRLWWRYRDEAVGPAMPNDYRVIFRSATKPV